MRQIKTVNHQLARDELIVALKEQLYFLDQSLISYVSNCEPVEFINKKIGKPFRKVNFTAEVEAKRIATVVRTLVHDTNNSKSVLEHLCIKRTTLYLNTANPDDGKLHSMTGMRNVKGYKNDPYFGLVAKINIGNRMIATPLFRQHLPNQYSCYPKCFTYVLPKSLTLPLKTPHHGKYQGITLGKKEQRRPVPYSYSNYQRPETILCVPWPLHQERAVG